MDWGRKGRVLVLEDLTTTCVCRRGCRRGGDRRSSHRLVRYLGLEGFSTITFNTSRPRSR